MCDPISIAVGSLLVGTGLQYKANMDRQSDMRKLQRRETMRQDKLYQEAAGKLAQNQDSWKRTDLEQKMDMASTERQAQYAKAEANAPRVNEALPGQVGSNAIIGDAFARALADASGQAAQQGDLLGPARVVGGFQNQRNVVEARIGHDEVEHRHSQFAFVERGMAVDPTAETLLRAIQVHGAQKAKTDRAVEFGEGLLAPLRCPQVVAGRQCMAGVEADADPASLVDLLDHRRELLEAKTEVAALPGGVFDHCGDAGHGRQRQIDRLGNAGDAVGLADLVEVAAGMEIEQRQAELPAALHLVDEGGARLVERRRVGMTQIDQIAVVRQDLRRCDAATLAAAAKRTDLGLGQRLGLPLPLVLGEEGEGVGADLLRTQRRLLHAAGGADMGANVLHSSDSRSGLPCWPCGGTRNCSRLCCNWAR